MEFKIGDWAIPLTTHTESNCLFDIWSEGVVPYWCRKATQKEIEDACAEMDKDIAELCKK